ncbi:hypothetical protein AgCh_035422 [Apium graveolens]
MKQSRRDYCLFTKTKNGKMTLVVVYVDDLIISGDDAECIADLKQQLEKAFTIKDLGLLIYFLGIEVSRNEQGTMLNQRKYIHDLVEDAGLSACKETKFPLQKDTVTANQTISDGHTIVSAGGDFEMGFFSSQGNPTNRYFGVWFKKISNGTVIWVANRNSPIFNMSGVVRVSSRGIVVSTNQTTTVSIWTSNFSGSVKNPVAQLLDTGNLVFRDENEQQKFAWQSFDYPVDNFLAGMKFGYDLVNGIDRYFSSWKSEDDPSLGDYIHRLDKNGFPQLMVWKDSDAWYRYGPWVGSRFSGNSVLKPNGIYTTGFVITETEAYYYFNRVNSESPATRLALTPDTRWSWYNMSMSLAECENKCLKDCNCTAYSNTDIRNGGTGCLLWFGGLMDIRGYSDDGQDLYVRMPASELKDNRKFRVKKHLWIILVPVPAVLTLMIGSFLWYAYKAKRLKRAVLMILSILALENHPGSARVSKELCLAILL